MEGRVRDQHARMGSSRKHPFQGGKDVGREEKGEKWKA